MNIAGSLFFGKAGTALKHSSASASGDGGLIPADASDWLQYVSPAHFSNINFRGPFTFPINEYQDPLLLVARAASNA